jgi:uncharacterized protein YuzE
MKINYDKIANALYVSIREGKVAETVKMHDRLLADVDGAGNVIGIELLDVSNQLQKKGIENLEKSVKEGIPVEIVSGTPAVA